MQIEKDFRRSENKYLTNIKPCKWNEEFTEEKSDFCYFKFKMNFWRICLNEKRRRRKLIFPHLKSKWDNSINWMKDKKNRQVTRFEARNEIRINFKIKIELIFSLMQMCQSCVSSLFFISNFDWDLLFNFSSASTHKRWNFKLFFSSSVSHNSHLASNYMLSFYFVTLN